MSDKIKKSAMLYLCFWVTSCLLPVMSWARLAVPTEVVSGNIAQKYEDRSIRLDNGKTYLSSRAGLSIDLPVGEPVTLRYYVEDSSKNIFFEFASGLNSLKKLEPVLPKKNNELK
jgi:hypothetical protein